MDDDSGESGMRKWSVMTTMVRSFEGGDGGDCVTAGLNHDDSIQLDNGRGGGGQYPYVWLRNNCPCSSCISDESGFRKQVICDFPFRSIPVDFEVNDAY